MNLNKLINSINPCIKGYERFFEEECISVYNKIIKENEIIIYLSADSLSIESFLVSCDECLIANNSAWGVDLHSSLDNKSKIYQQTPYRNWDDFYYVDDFEQRTKKEGKKQLIFPYKMLKLLNLHYVYKHKAYCKKNSYGKLIKVIQEHREKDLFYVTINKDYLNHYLYLINCNLDRGFYFYSEVEGPNWPTMIDENVGIEDFMSPISYFENYNFSLNTYISGNIEVENNLAFFNKSNIIEPTIPSAKFISSVVPDSNSSIMNRALISELTRFHNLPKVCYISPPFFANFKLWAIAIAKLDDVYVSSISSDVLNSIAQKKEVVINECDNISALEKLFPDIDFGAFREIREITQIMYNKEDNTEARDFVFNKFGKLEKFCEYKAFSKHYYELEKKLFFCVGNLLKKYKEYL